MQQRGRCHVFIRVVALATAIQLCVTGCVDSDQASPAGNPVPGQGNQPVRVNPTQSPGDPGSAALPDLQSTLDDLGFPTDIRPPGAEVRMESGNLSMRFCDNSESPTVLSGLTTLEYTDRDRRESAFDSGLNLEHIISGHDHPANRFKPRAGPYRLCRAGDGDSVTLVRLRDDSPWAVSHATRLTPSAPHAVDIEFRCRVHDADRFGLRGYAVFFWANYMRRLDDIAIYFRGIDRAGGAEHWVRAASPDGGRTYVAADAEPLEFDDDHNNRHNLVSFDYPRFTQPLLYGRCRGGMVLMLMFDRMVSVTDEIRFSHFVPAWDFQYVIHRVETGGRYEFRARLIWKPWVSEDDCLEEFATWRQNLKAITSKKAPRSTGG